MNIYKKIQIISYGKRMEIKLKLEMIIILKIEIILKIINNRTKKYMNGLVMGNGNCGTGK